ncbi:MAG: sodium:solute symporter family transporter [Pirellulaceae bacterium]
MLLATLTSIDYGVIAFYMLAMVALGFYFANEQRTTQDFFLGGRSFSWFPLGMSLMATLIPALSYTGLPGQAYEHGLRCLILPLSVWLALPIMIGVVLPIYRGLGLYSLYEYLELRFDSRTRLLGGLIFVVWRMLWLGGVIYAPCKVLVISSGTDIPEWVLISILGAVTTFYTFLGGMKAVIWTDVIQGIAMLGGVVVVILGVWWQTAGGHARVTDVAIDLGRMQPATFTMDLGGAWVLWGALPHWFLANLSFYAADQITAQRFLSAKSVDAARTSYLVNCIVLTLLQPGLIYIGLCMLAFYQDHPEEMQPNWVASIDNKTREVVRDEKGRLLLDPKHHPEEEISVETIDQLVKEGRILKPNTHEPYTKSDELVDRDAGRVRVEKLLIRRPPNEFDMSEVVVRKGAPEEMLPRFIATHLPWGAAGLIVAALLAACMSSIDSGLNSICTLLVMDFHRRYGIGRAWLAKRLGKTPETLNESDELKLAQPLTLAVGVGATLFAMAVAQVRDIFEIMIAIANTFGAPLLAVFLLGMFTRRCTGKGAFFGLVTGSMLTVGISALSLLKKYGFVAPEVWPFHDIWTVTFGVVFTLVAGYGASLVFGKAKSKTELRGLVYGVGHLGVLAVDEEAQILGEIDPDAPGRWK